MTSLKFSFKEVIVIVGFCVGLAGNWWSLNSKMAVLETKVTAIQGQMQWLLGEAIREGWNPPVTEWIFPTSKKNKSEDM